MSSYKTSKAWHIGHELALATHQAVKSMPGGETSELAVRLRQTSALAPQKIAESIALSQEHELLDCLTAARDAMLELQQHLSLARDVHYIEARLFKELTAQSIEVHRLLNELIRGLKRSLNPATE